MTANAPTPKPLSEESTRLFVHFDRRYRPSFEDSQALRNRFGTLEAEVERLTKVGPGLPKGESEARDEICNALAELIRGIATIAEGSGESAVLDIRREWSEGPADGSLTVRGLLRFMTTCDPGGRDGAYGELVERTWVRVGRALTTDGDRKAIRITEAPND